MAQEIKRRLFSSRKVLTVLLVLTLVGAALLALSVFAEGDVIVTAGSAEGDEGDRVEIPVTIENRSGAAGAQFKIYFDASIVDVTELEDEYEPGEFYFDVELGDIYHPAGTPYLTSNVISDATGDYVSIAIASARSFVADGTMCTIGFDLKSSGTTSLELVDVLVSDTAPANLPYTSVNGSITVRSWKLDQVEKPTWDGNTIKWNGVANATNYTVNLYKGAAKVWNGVVPASASSLNLGNYMSDNGPGSYTATVKALATAPYINGPESDHSEAKTYSVTLGKVGKPAWGTGWTITWTDLPAGSPNYGDHVNHYNVNLEKEGSGSTLKTVAVNPGVGQHTFGSGDFDGPGSYYVTVQAIGDYNFYLNGPLSDASAAKVRKEQLGQVSKPTWDATELGLIKWSAVENAAQYKVELFKDGSTVETKTVTNLSHNFLNTMRSKGVGSYTVRVTALAAAGSNYEDGPSSAVSEARVVAKLNAPAQPAFSSQGVATWSAVTGADGYTVNLYKGSTLVEGYTTSPTDEREYDFFWAVLENGPGSYTVKVAAMGTGYDLNSDESAASEARVAAALDAPTGLAWQSDDVPVLSWTAVNGAESYKVQLYKGGTAIGSPLNATGTSYDFTTVIGDTAGYYTAKVQAVGDDYFVLDSPLSALSATFTKTGPLGQVADLVLSDKGVATWVDEPDAVSFKVQLYKVGSGALGSVLNVDPGVQSADFRDAMRGAGVGVYYVSVTAIAEDGSLFSDGNLFNSNDQTVSKLAAPAGVSLSNQGVSTWNAVANATGYSVTLTLPAGHPSGSAKTYTTTAQSMNHLAVMRQHPGAYKVTVTAKDTVGLHLDSDGADSAGQTVIKLGKAAKPGLSNMGEATWTAVDDAIKYTVALYKGSALVVKKTVASTITSYDFLSEIQAAGAGKYTVTVTALGNEYLVLDGEPSAASDPVTVKVLQKMNRPGWAIDELTGEITLDWAAVTGATGYEITIYNGSGEDPATVTVSGSTYTFTPPEAGFYWVTIRALGSGVTLDGPMSGRSDILVAFGGGIAILGYDPPAEGYVASGWLPVPGYLWMQITSETGQDGIMKVQRGSTSAYDAPAGLTAAGLFFEIEFDENLSGSHVLLEAGYDPAALPKWMKEASLRFYRYDAEKGWVLLDSEVDTAEKIISAEIDHFSTIGVFGEVSAPPADDKPGVSESEKTKGELEGELPRTYGYIPYLLLGGIALALAGLFFFRRRKGLESR